MPLFVIFQNIRKNDFHKTHIFHMNLIFIWKVTLKRDNKRFRSESKYAVLEKWIFENFRKPLHDDIIL